MDVRNCKKCGRVFNYLSGMPICPACREKTEEKFQEVKEFVRDNKGATIYEIAEKCDVEEGQIRQWVREERLEFASDSGIGVECENCGAIIFTGRFCAKCKTDMVNTFSSITKRAEVFQPQKKDSRENPRMRFLDNH